MVGNIISPYERHIRKAVQDGATALVIVRNRLGIPGQSMYQILSDNRDLTIPVVEVFQLAVLPGSIASSVGPAGVHVSIYPQENQWKKANDVIGFQIFLDVVHTGLETAILIVGLWRIHQWTTPSCGRLFSIGPVCIALEMVAAVLRLVYTAVDPFWTFRVYNAFVGMIMMTISFPISLASGILLTFFWAETLKASSIKAHPFIAEYKKSACLVIFILVAGEIISNVIRTKVPVKGKFNTVYLTQAFYIVTCIILVICYLVCAHEITRRLSSGNHVKRKRYIRNMNIRFAVSTAGYIIFIISMAASIPVVSHPWGFKCVFNGMFLGLNIAGILQVYSLKPSGNHSSTSSRGTNKKTNSDPRSSNTSQSSSSAV